MISSFVTGYILDFFDPSTPPQKKVPKKGWMRMTLGKNMVPGQIQKSRRSLVEYLMKSKEYLWGYLAFSHPFLSLAAA